MFEEFYGGTKGKDGFTIFSEVLQPKSRGSIRLKSQNPFEHLIGDPNYLSKDEDVQVLLDGKCVRIDVMKVH